MQIADAQVANSELKLQLAAANEQLAKLNTFNTDLERYTLWETPHGTVVYRLKQAEQGAEPMHYLCPNCVEDRKKSILQGHENYRECPRCSTGFTFGSDSGVLIGQTRNRHFDSY